MVDGQDKWRVSYKLLFNVVDGEISNFKEVTPTKLIEVN